MKTTFEAWRIPATLAVAVAIGAGCAATPGMDDVGTPGDIAATDLKSPASQRVVAGIVEMVLTNQAWPTFEQARENPISILNDGSPLFAYIRATRPLGELAHPSDAGGSYAFSDYPHLFLQVGDIDSLRILATCYLTLTGEEARMRELVVPLAPLTYRPGQIPADCWLASVVAGGSGKRTYELRLAGFAGKFESWLPVADLLAVTPVFTELSNGSAEYAAMLRATPLGNATLLASTTPVSNVSPGSVLGPAMTVGPNASGQAPAPAAPVAEPVATAPAPVATAPAPAATAPAPVATAPAAPVAEPPAQAQVSPPVPAAPEVSVPAVVAPMETTAVPEIAAAAPSPEPAVPVQTSPVQVIPAASSPVPDVAAAPAAAPFTYTERTPAPVEARPAPFTYTERTPAPVEARPAPFTYTERSPAPVETRPAPFTYTERSPAPVETRPAPFTYTERSPAVATRPAPFTYTERSPAPVATRPAPVTYTESSPAPVVSAVPRPAPLVITSSNAPPADPGAAGTMAVDPAPVTPAPIGPLAAVNPTALSPTGAPGTGTFTPPARNPSLVATDSAPLPGQRQDIGSSRMELQLQTLSTLLLGRQPSEAYFMDRQWTSTTDQRGRVVQQHAYAAAVFKGASCSWLRLRAFRRPGAPGLLDVVPAGEPIEVNCADLR